MVTLVDVVLKEPPAEEILGGSQFRRVRCQFHFSFAADETLPIPFMESCHDIFSYCDGKKNLAGTWFLLIKVPNLFELSPEILITRK